MTIFSFRPSISCSSKGSGGFGCLSGGEGCILHKLEEEEHEEEDIGSVRGGSGGDMSVDSSASASALLGWRRRMARRSRRRSGFSGDIVLRRGHKPRAASSGRLSILRALARRQYPLVLLCWPSATEQALSAADQLRKLRKPMRYTQAT